MFNVNRSFLNFSVSLGARGRESTNYQQLVDLNGKRIGGSTTQSNLGSKHVALRQFIRYLMLLELLRPVLLRLVRGLLGVKILDNSACQILLGLHGMHCA